MTPKYLDFKILEPDDQSILQDDVDTMMEWDDY